MKTLRRILLLLLLLTPFIDIANATFIRNSVFLGNIGQIYKGAVILLSLIVLTKKQRSLYLLALGLGGLFSGIHYLFSVNPTLTNFVNDILFVVKVTYIIPLTFILTTVSKRYILITSATAWITIVANILLGVAGFGYTQYALAYGYKGFFFSGNEMALTLMVTSAILLYLIYEQKKWGGALAFSITLLFLGPLQGMKTLLIGLPLIALIIPTLQYKDSIFSSIKRLSTGKKIGILAGVAMFATSAILILYTISPQFFVRFSEITARSGILGAIVSERDKYLSAGLTEYSQTFTLQEKIFGVGYIPAQQSLITHFKNPKTIEIDFFDLLLSFGVLAVVYYTVWIYFLFTNKNANSFTIFVNALLLVLSLLTGHVVYSTFLATYWAICNGMMTKKRETQVVFIGPLSRGGIRTYMIETAKNFAKNGIHISSYNTHSPIDFPITTLRLLLLTITSGLTNKRLIFHYHLATGGSFVRKLLLSFFFYSLTDVQILHIHGGKAPVFFTQILKLPGGALLLRLFFSLFDRIIVVSKGLHAEIHNVLENYQMHYHKDRWIALQNAIELPERFPTPPTYKLGETLKVLFLGRLVSVKNLPLLMDIIEQTHAKKLPVHFTIVGDGPERTAIEKRIHEKQLQPTVSLTGWVAHEQVDSLYKNHHLFIITSMYESFGLVVLEAYKNGLPALSTNIGGLRDVVEDNKSGFLFDSRDSEGFVHAIEKITKNPKLLQTLQEGARQKVAEFDYTDHIKKLTAILFT